MATYRVRDRSGGTLEVSGKEQADAWVAVGYTIVTDEDVKKATAARKTAAKSAPSKSAAEK